MRQLLAELLALVILSSTLFCWVLGDTHYYEFVLREKKYTRLCNTKSMLVVNDSFPGPVIRVHKGDTVFVNVHNHGDYGVTLHWHGVKQPRNPWSDGPEYITQCPIQPGSNFTYKVLFSTEEGTLWWHAHSDWTQNSVHGAIVIMPAKGTDHPFPKPDEEEIIVLGSWYSYDVNKRVNYDLAIGADLPREEAFLFNGQPGGIFNCSRDTQYRLVVDYGKTYLIRLINAATSSELLFAIADHNVTVVGMDGAYLKPLSTSFLVISPGQTMNLLLTANQPPRQYYMAIRQYVTNGDPDVYPANTAILEYRGNYSRRPDPVFPSQLPSYINISSAEFFLAGLRSLNSKEHPAFVPQEITHHMYIVVSVKQVLCNPSECEIGMAMASAMNNITFLNPHVDVLQAYYRNLSGVYTDDFPDFPLYYYNFTGDNLPNDTAIPTIATKVKILDFNQTIQIVFQDSNVLRGAENHPMHMHGYSFFVVGSGPGNYDNETAPSTFNLVDPPEVNTFRVPKDGWVAVRFRADNPGVWMWHCHVNRHLTWGLNTAFIVRGGGTPETSMLEPPPGMPTCDSSVRHYIQKFRSSELPAQ